MRREKSFRFEKTEIFAFFREKVRFFDFAKSLREIDMVCVDTMQYNTTFYALFGFNHRDFQF